MKNIILTLSLLIFYSCNAQKPTKNKEAIQYYNLNQYKDWEYDPEWCWPQEPCSRENSHFYLMKGNERIRVWSDDEIIKVEKTNTITPYTFHKSYSSKNKILVSEWIEFYRAFTGIDKQYKEDGSLISETDQDKPYQFSIKDMVKKFKEEYNTDLLNRKNVHRFYRYENSKTLGIPIYKIYLNTDIGNKWMEYLIDGNSGKTLYTMKSSEGDTTDILEEYLKSIGKFKGSSTKYDPSTD